MVVVNDHSDAHAQTALSVVNTVSIQRNSISTINQQCLLRNSQGSSQRKRKNQLSDARTTRKEKPAGDENAPEVGRAETVVLRDSGDAYVSNRLGVEPRPVLGDVNRNQPQIEGISASATKLRRFSGAGIDPNAQPPAELNRRSWCFAECSQLN